MSGALKILIVLPTFNEAENLPLIAQRLLDLPVRDVQLLIIDDNSPDGTGAIADALAAKFPDRVQVLHRERKLGLGTAYVAGFTRALEQGFDAAIEMDSDFSHPVEALPKMIGLVAAGTADVAVGSRYVPGGRVDEDWSVWRKFLSWWGSVYSRAILGLTVHDTTAGFKCFHRRVLERLPLGSIVSNGYAFQVEMAYLCQQSGFRAVEVPIVFLDRTRGESKMSMNVALEASWRVWQIKWRRY